MLHPLSYIDGLKALWRRNARGCHFEVTVVEDMEHLTLLLKYCVSLFLIPDEILISIILQVYQASFTLLPS